MKKTKATVRDLRYHFREIEARLAKGEEIEVHKRQRAIARLVPISPTDQAYPDFAAIRRRIFGRKKMRTTGTDVVSYGRGCY
jgi:antitoxin (DNA-binding transcriptional repressor) of toxin-antitoxin stability system